MKFDRLIVAFVVSISLSTVSIACEKKVKHDEFTIYLTPEHIAMSVRELASKIDADYTGQEITLVCVLKGALVFTADLMRALETPTRLECVQASSYGDKEIAGALTLRGLENVCLKDKDVLIVDDIYDTGNTMEKLKQEFLKQEPKSLKSCVFLLKDVKRVNERKPDYYAIEIENKWVDGYGLDSYEQRRGLPGIWAKKS